MAPPEPNNPEEPKGSDPNLTESGKTGDEGKQENLTIQCAAVLLASKDSTNRARLLRHIATILLAIKKQAQQEHA